MDITPLPAEQFVPWTEGLYDLPEELYHSHSLCPEISRSLIVELLTTSPAHVRALMDGVATKKKVTQPMIIGSLMDRALLEPDRFKEGKSHWVRPDGMNLNSNAGRAWSVDHSNLARITSQEARDITGMIDAVMSHKLARRIVEEGIKQESAFCKDPDTGILRKVRVDSRLIENSGRVVLGDLKAGFRGSAAALTWSSHCARMSYHLQDVFYSDVYRDLTGEDPFFVFLCVERVAPYAVRLFQIHEEGRRVGREKYKRALDTIAICKETGDWPSYPEKIEIIKLPAWELAPRDPIVYE